MDASDPGCAQERFLAVCAQWSVPRSPCGARILEVKGNESGVHLRSGKSLNLDLNKYGAESKSGKIATENNNSMVIYNQLFYDHV
jgi:hypothetical protein